MYYTPPGHLQGEASPCQATVLLIKLQGQAEAKDNLRVSLLDLRLSSPNHKQNRCSLFEGLEVMSYQRRGVSSGWKYSSSLPSSIIKKKKKTASLDKLHNASWQIWVF